MENRYLLSGILAVVLIPIDLVVFFGTRWFYGGLILSLTISSLPVFLKFLEENKKQKLVEGEWLEYVRGLVEGVRSGLPIPQCILNLKDKDYGNLTINTRKLANQVEWGIPVGDALQTFANDTKNKVVKRNVAILTKT